MKHAEAKICQCHLTSAPRTKPPDTTVKTTARSIISVLPSVLLALFPKCPVCWAAYMSLFGSAWVARMPYVAELFPVLLALSGLNLALLLKKSPQKGFTPFLLSLTGVLVLLGGRTWLPQDRWIISLGVALMLAGSLLNSFSTDHFKKAFLRLTRKQDQS